MIDVGMLEEGRAGYDQEIVAKLSPQSTARHGRGYDRTHPCRMARFSQQFPDPGLVASLAQQVSWTHFRELLPLATDGSRTLYVKETIDPHLNVRELRHAIERKAFERREIADSQIPEGSGGRCTACCWRARLPVGVHSHDHLVRLARGGAGLEGVTRDNEVGSCPPRHDAPVGDIRLSDHTAPPGLRRVHLTFVPSTVALRDLMMITTSGGRRGPRRGNLDALINWAFEG